MTHNAKSPDGLHAVKINKSDRGAGVTLQPLSCFKASKFAEEQAK